MKILHRIDKYYWACITGAITVGFTLPDLFSGIDAIYSVYIIMAILFLLFLKVDVADMIYHIKKPGLILYITFFNMIVVPILTYFIFSPLQMDYAMGLLLLAALPAGASSAVFTDMMQGRTPLSLMFIIVSTLVAPFTIPLLFYMLHGASLPIEYEAFVVNLLKIIFFPLVLSQIIKTTADAFVSKLHNSINALVVFLYSFMIMFVVANQSSLIISNIQNVMYLLGILYSAFLMFQLLSYFSVFWLSKGEKVSVSNSKIIMNNILGIVLALAFFGEQVQLIVVLSIIPWNTMVFVFHWYKRYLP